MGESTTARSEIVFRTAIHHVSHITNMRDHYELRSRKKNLDLQCKGQIRLIS
jgi:hypothetical protein